MIVVIESSNAHKYPDLMDQMFQTRARVFRDRMRWDVTVERGRERDKYDDETPVYILWTDEKCQNVKGSLRLLPTTGPTVLADFFADTIPDAALLSAPSIWECTRFCLNERQVENPLFASTLLTVALGELALSAGIQTIVANFDPAMLRLYKLMGCEVELLGYTHRFERPVYLGSFPISDTHLRKLKRGLNDPRSLGSARAEVLAA